MDIIQETNIIQETKNRNLENIKKLVKSGISVDTTDENGKTLLMITLNKQSKNVRKILKIMNPKYFNNLDIEIANFLIGEGADINAQDRDGNTALMLASENGDIESVKFLYDLGADINAQDRDGNTALMLAAQTDNIDIVEYLLERNADISTLLISDSMSIRAIYEPEKGDTPLMKTIIDNDFMAFELLCEEHEGLGDDYVDIQNNEGQTALHIAVLLDRFKFYNGLLDMDADPHIVDRNGMTPNTIKLIKGENNLRLLESFMGKDQDLLFDRMIIRTHIKDLITNKLSNQMYF